MWEIGINHSFERIMAKREKCDKQHDINNVNNVNIDFIYNYIHWASFRSLYFSPVMWLQVARRKNKSSKEEVRERNVKE